MKKALFSFLTLAALLLIGCTEKKDANINVTVDEKLQNETWLVTASPFYPQGNDTIITDTLVAEKGVITYTLSPDTIYFVDIYPASAIVGSGITERVDETRKVTVILSGQDHVNLNLTDEGSFISYTVEGQELSQTFATFHNEFRKTDGQKLNDIYAKFEKLDENDMDAMYELSNEFQTLLTAHLGKMQTFADEHPDTDFAALFALIYTEDGEEQHERIEQLTDKVRNGMFKAAIDNALEQYEQLEESNDARKNMKAGNAAPDFTATDFEGKTISLSDYKGKKYVVIDFWGTWCYWCMKGVPDMKAYYHKYSNKVEFIGINCGDEEEAFRKCVSEQEMNWRHIINPTDDDLTVKYGVQGFPTKIIVDKNGNIAAYIEGEDPAFYKKLDELFK